MANYFPQFSYNGVVTNNISDPRPQLEQALLANPQATSARKPGKLTADLQLSLCYPKSNLQSHPQLFSRTRAITSSILSLLDPTDLPLLTPLLLMLLYPSNQLSQALFASPQDTLAME